MHPSPKKVSISVIIFCLNSNVIKFFRKCKNYRILIKNNLYQNLQNLNNF